MPMEPVALFPRFSFDDWLADIQWAAACINDNSRFHESTIEAYFERKYGEQAGPRGRRAMRAIEYFMRHREDFDEGKLGIDSEHGFAPGTLLLRALLTFYNQSAENEVTTDWPVDQVKEIAREIEAQRISGE